MGVGVSSSPPSPSSAGDTLQCGALSDWEDSRGSSPKVRQVDSRTALLDWSQLWTTARWRGCVESAAVVITAKGGRRREEVEVDRPEERRNLTVAVTPCEETRFLVRVRLSTGEEVDSFRSAHGFKTHLPPRAKTAAADAAVVTRGGGGKEGGGGGGSVIDLTTAEVMVAFSDVVDDPACRRVVATELRFRRAGETTWTVAKTLASPFRRLEERLEGLADLCSDYEVALELVGTEGTGGTLARLASLEAPGAERMREAWESGFRWEAGAAPGAIRVVGRSDRRLEVEWDPPPAPALLPSCATGYVAVLRDEKGRRDREERTTGGEERRAEFVGLAPCRKYKVEVFGYLRIDGERRFQGKAAEAEAATAAAEEDGKQFRVSSLGARSGRTSITLDWLTGEWGPCLGRLGARLCKVEAVDVEGHGRGKEVNSSSCLSPSSSRVINDRAVVTFQHLEACASYKVSIQYVLL